METQINTAKTLKRKRKSIFADDAWQLYVMCSIPLLLVFIFNYLPMGGIVIAFKNYTYADGIFGSEWCGFDNFKFFIKSNDFLKITWNTLYMNVIFIIVGLISALFSLRSRVI